MIIENMKEKSWQELLIASFGPQGYKPVMRKSLQTVVLYEGVRCCKPMLQKLKPFQRKIALHDMAKALAETLDFLTAEQKSQLLWRTNVSQEIMDEHNMWQRRKVIVREVEKLSKTMKPYLAKEQTQEDALRVFLREMYEATPAEKQLSEPPPNWQYKHSHLILCYRLYYLNGELNPNFPEPNPPKPILVVGKKPSRMMKKSNNQVGRQMAAAAAAAASEMEDDDDDDEADGEDGAMDDDETSDPSPMDDEEVTIPKSPPTGKGKSGKIAAGPLRRRKMMLEEVREHLDLLKEFEGVIPPEELAERKRQLYYRLPLPPLAGKTKKAKF